MMNAWFECERVGEREGGINDNLTLSHSLPHSLTPSNQEESISRRESDELGGNFQYANKDTTNLDF